MQLGNWHIGFAAKQEVAVPSGETGWSESNLYNTIIGKYNPDDLISRKGFGIYRKMMLDEQVKAVVRFKRDAITSREWHFDAPEELSEDEAKRRIAISTAIIDQLQGSFVDALNGILTGMHNGYSMTEILIGQINVGGAIYYGVDKLRLRPFDTFIFKTDSHGNVEKVIQQFEQQKQEIDPTRFIHYVQSPEEDEHYGQSELRAAYRSYWSKDVLIKLYNIYMERKASGFVYAKPTEGRTIEPGSAVETALRNVLSNISSKTAIILPSGVDLTVVHPQGEAGFEAAIAVHDKAIAKALLVPNLLGITEQGDTGSYSQSQTQFEAFLMTLDADASRLEDTLNEQLFRRLSQYNFGDDNCPRFSFSPMSDDRKFQLLSMWKELVQSGAVRKGDADEDKVRSLLGFPQRQEQQSNAPDGGSASTPVTPGTTPSPVEDTGVEPPTNKAAFAEAVKRVDFEAIDQGSQAIEREHVKAVQSATDAVINYIKARVTTDAEEVAQIEVPVSLREPLRRAFGRMLKDAWRLGESQAKEETVKTTSFAEAPPDPLGAAAAAFFKAKSFTMAGGLSDRVLGKVQQIVFNGIKNNLTLDEISANVDAAIETAGFNSSQIDTMVRTNTFEAINEARFNYFKGPALGDFVEALEYSAVLDDRTTQICQHLDGHIHPSDSDVWNKYRPPNHYNCRSLLIAVTVDDTWTETKLPTIEPQEGFK